jgi:solute carrier family 13 (sodium-dependent dicarboxylate transporter), member 2/3/5
LHENISPEISEAEEQGSQNDSRQSALRRYTGGSWGLGRHVLLAAAAFLVAAVVGYGLTDQSFNDSQNHTVFILVFAILLWLTEAVPPFAVGLLIICFQLVAYGTPLVNSAPVDAQKYLNTWSSSVIFLMLGGFFLADGMRKTGLDREIFRLALSFFGRKPGNVLLGLMLTAAVLSMVMSNTATTAMMIAAVMPFLRTLTPEAGFRKAVLVGIPAAASVGGMGTIIGSPPNAVAVGALAQAGVTVSFLDWMLLGVPLALVLCLGFWWALGKKYQWGSTPVTIEVESSEETALGSRRTRYIVIGTSLTTMSLWLTSGLHQIPVATVSAVPVAILTVTGVLEAKDMRGLPWDTLMLVAGGLALGLAIVDFGVAEYYLGQLDLQGATMVSLMLVFGFITVILSNVMSNTATASILIPIAGILLDDKSAFVTIMIALSASAALMLPVSTPPNAIAYSTEMIKPRDFRFGGTLVGGITPVLVVGWVWVLWTFLQ